MSHVTTISIEIKDLAALVAAAKELGCEWRENQTHYAWYGKSVGDYPLPDGIKREDLGKCAHAIRVPGVEYEVGVVRKPDGKYTLAYDFWGPGQGLLKKLGENCSKLSQMYAVHAATRAAKAKGLLVQRKNQDNGAIKLVVTTA